MGLRRVSASVIMGYSRTLGDKGQDLTVEARALTLSAVIAAEMFGKCESGAGRKCIGLLLADWRCW